ncbi:MAG: hypothetical protein JNL10_16385 [Verrucomicrobiales bacterium]|nr:hypothetical protein [Verrucomicrobiales bacterium]
MKFAARIALYLLLVVLAGYFFGRFRAAYQSTPVVRESVTEGTSTNEPTTETNAVPAAVGDVSGTNSPTAAVPPSPTPGAVNGGNSQTNAVALTNATTAHAPATPAPKGADSLRYLGLFVLFFLALGGLAAWDMAQALGSRAGRAVMADDWVERKDPEYEKAEEEWSKGNHMDAIALMREYLAKNPREQHVAIRIAEIYEKDLGNHLAAALELQEVLTKRLPKERWGWTAIRLSNLYSGRLNQPDKAMALLERIVNEYSDTGAAKKARARLGIPEPVVAAPAEEAPAAEAAAEPDSPSAESDTPPEPPASNLPKGFRPKK